MLFQLKKLPEIINLTRFLKSFWILYIDQIIVYDAFYSKLTFYIIKDRCQMHTLKVFRSPVWLLLHKLSSPHYRYIRKMRRGDRLPLTQHAISAYRHKCGEFESHNVELSIPRHERGSNSQLAASRWLSPGIPVSSTNKTDCHDITKILLKVALNTIIPIYVSRDMSSKYIWYDMKCLFMHIWI